MSTILVSTLRTRIRAATNRDSDQRVTDAQLDTMIDEEYAAARRRIVERVRGPFSTFDDSFYLFDGQTTIKKPTDFEVFCRLEEWFQGSWEPLDVAKAYNPTDSEWRSFREEGQFFVVYPADSESNVNGYYRLTYVPYITPGYSSVILPDGFETVIEEAGAARVRERLEEDPTPHLRRAAIRFDELIKTLERRYGWHLRNGMRERRVERWRVNTSSSTPPPTPAPDPLTVTSTSASAVGLSWGAVPGDATYTVYRSTTPYTGFVALAAATDIAGTVHTDSTVVASTTYYYVVKATRWATVSAPSNQVKVVAED